MKEIIHKYLEGKTTEAENKILLEWLGNKENRFSFHRFKLDWKKSLDKSWFSDDSEKNWEKIQAGLLKRSFGGWQRSESIAFIYRFAAIFFFLVALGSITWLVVNQPKPEQEVYSEVFADSGQMSKVILPDGSMVWLNSGSKITYGNRFMAETRKVKVEGEAWFDVAHNQEIPFFVDCGELHVKVLGTQFNVSAYPESGKVDVVLEKGSVELLNRNGKSLECKMKPGEMASYNSEIRKIKVSMVNTQLFTSWKEGIINIYYLPLEELVKKLELRYNQKFELDAEVSKLRYTFTIKNESLEDILKLMQRITPVRVDQKGSVIKIQLKRTYKKSTG